MLTPGEKRLLNDLEKYYPKYLGQAADDETILSAIKKRYVEVIGYSRKTMRALVKITRKGKTALKKENALRQATLRLAFEKPQLRPYLLPLLASSMDHEKKLTGWATQAFALFRDPTRDNAETSMDVLSTVLRQAKRMGLTADQVIRWLQSAYGSVWVRQTNMNPGVDLKDLVQETKRRLS